MSTKNSKNSPIRVDMLPCELLGSVGITFAPGKHGSSRFGATWVRNLDADLDRLVSKYGIQVLVCLLQDAELDHLKISNLVEEAEKRGMEVVRLPIPDGGVLPDLEPMRALVKRIVAAAKEGKNVVIHCRGGLGRAGTVGGCFLVDQGASHTEAFRCLRAARGRHCPETEGQKSFIVEYEQSFGRPAPLGTFSLPRGAAAFPPDDDDPNPEEIESFVLHLTSLPMRDRFVGAVLGAAVGDAMGHPTEFLKTEEIRAKYGPEGVRGFELYWGTPGAGFAPYTDDTQMAEAVARALIDGAEKQLDLDGTMKLMAARFIDWNRNPQGGHRAPGGACRRGCAALERGVPWHEAGGPTDGGCGSVMRAYPFGLLFYHDLRRAERWAVAHSKLTHRDPIALAACAAMAVGVARAVMGQPVALITSEMVAAACRYSPKTAGMMTRAIHEARTGVQPSVVLERLQGWAAHEAIAAAVYIFERSPNDPNAAILEGANAPGDSDSLATLAGALTGAYMGGGMIRETWCEKVERSHDLELLGLRLLIAAHTQQ